MNTAPINASFCQTFRFRIISVFRLWKRVRGESSCEAGGSGARITPAPAARASRLLEVRIEQPDGNSGSGGRGISNVPANAGDEILFGWQLDQVVVGAGASRPRRCIRTVVSRKHDDRGVKGRRILSKPPYHRQPVDVGHDEILQDHRRADLLRAWDGIDRGQAAVQVDIGLGGQQSAYSHSDELLIVD